MTFTAFLFTDVRDFSATGLKPIDGLSAGKFTSMSGYEVEFKAEELEVYARNTNQVIASTATEGGEVVGLPIDMDMHDHRGGAGWIKEVVVDAERKILRFMVEWTDAGADVIRKNIRRFFSPSTDPSNKTVIGGSLTNWPATRDAKSGRILLRPIELSQSLKEIDMPQTLEELEAGQAELKTSVTELKTLLAGISTKLTELSAGTPPAAASGAQDPERINPQLLELLGSEAEVDDLAARAADMAKDVIRAEKRKNQIVEFAARVAGGTKAKPFGLKVRAADLVKTILPLPEAQGNAVMKILEQSLDAAIDFAQHGIDGDGFLNKPELPEPYKKYAREFCAIPGNNIEGFFSANPEVGPIDNFNLSEFTKKEN